MKKLGFNKKRIISGAILLCVAVLFGILLESFIGPKSEMWQRLVWIAAVLGTGLSAILCSFLGLLGAAYGFGAILIIGLLNVLPKLLPDPWNRYFSLVYFAVLFAAPAIRRQKNAKKNRSQETERHMLPEEQEIPEWEEEVLLVYHRVTGRIYQLFRTSGEIRAYFVGGELKGVDENLLQNPKLTLRSMEKKDYKISVEEIISVQYKEFPANNTDLDGQFIVKAKKKYALCPYGSDDISRYVTFFREWLSEHAMPEQEKEELLPEKRMATFKKIHRIYMVYMVIVSLCWLFLNVPYMLFSFLALLGLPVLLIMYILFQDCMTILENTRSTKKISITVSAFGSTFALLLRTLLDYNILKWSNLLIISLAALGVCTAVLLILTKEWRKKKLAAVYIMLILALYLPGAVGQINCTFDMSEPREQMTTVEDLSVSTSSKSPDSYYVHVTLRDGTQVQLQTYKEHYDSLRKGDIVGVYVFDGTLGIPYAYVW